MGGGALEPYIDVQKGYKLYRPTAWNQFDTDPGVYDVKFQDVINSFETVQVSSSPVTTATSISALGDIASVAAKFAKSRNAALVSSSERDADGSLLYSMELQGDMYHEYLAPLDVESAALKTRAPSLAQTKNGLLSTFSHAFVVGASSDFSAVSCLTGGTNHYYMGQLRSSEHRAVH